MFAAGGSHGAPEVGDGACGRQGQVLQRRIQSAWQAVNFARPLFPCAVFEHAAVISNSEVATILTEYMRQRREEKPTFQPQPLVQKTLEYVQKFNCGTNPEAVQAMRK